MSTYSKVGHHLVDTRMTMKDIQETRMAMGHAANLYSDLINLIRKAWSNSGNATPQTAILS